MRQTIHADTVADRTDPADDGPTSESIARARAEQQRERAALTEATGVSVGGDGHLRRQDVAPSHPRIMLSSTAAADN